jgi:hypothetical protein
MAQATALILDSTHPEIPESANYFRLPVPSGLQADLPADWSLPIRYAAT